MGKGDASHSTQSQLQGWIWKVKMFTIRNKRPLEFYSERVRTRRTEKVDVQGVYPELVSQQAQSKLSTSSAFPLCGGVNASWPCHEA